MRPIKYSPERPRRCHCRKCTKCTGFGKEITLEGHQAAGRKRIKQRYRCKVCGHSFVAVDSRELNGPPGPEERCQWPLSECRKKGWHHVLADKRLCDDHSYYFERGGVRTTNKILAAWHDK